MVATSSSPVEEDYISTDDREMKAWHEAMVNGINGIGDTIEDEDLANFRSGV